MQTYSYSKNIRVLLGFDESKLDKSSFSEIRIDLNFIHPKYKSYSTKRCDGESILFYFFLNQSLQINNFRTSFKNPTSSKKPEKVRLINDGEDPIMIHSVSTAGDQFYVEGLNDTMELLSGEELNLDLFFRPDQYGFYTSRLIIKTSMPDHEEISIDLFGVRKRGKSYYKYIDGERYDRLLLEIAYSVMSQNPDKVIDYDQIRIITRNVWDAGYITTTEKRSLRYIWDHYDWSDNARKWFRVGYGESVGIN